MKKIYRSKFYSYFIFFVFILQIFFSIVCVSVILNMINENNALGIVFFSLELLLFTLLFILAYFTFNRGGAIIIYDTENKILIRKGYLFGYKSTLKAEDIIRVEKVTLPRDNTYYVLIDKEHIKYEGTSKASYFSIACSKEAKEFIEQFWDKPLDKWYS